MYGWVDDAMPERQAPARGKVFCGRCLLSRETLLLSLLLLNVPYVHELEEPASAERHDVELLDPLAARMDPQSKESLASEVPETPNDELYCSRDATSDLREIRATMMGSHDLDVEANASRGGRQCPVGEVEDLVELFGLQCKLDFQIRTSPTWRHDEVEFVVYIFRSTVFCSTVLDPEFCEAV